jgi:hypothetical protein
MVNHDAPHQLSGRRSSWVTSWRVDGASSYGLLDAANSNTAEGFFYSMAGGDQKKLRSRGGFQAAFPLYQMNRHNNKHAGKNQNRNQTLEKKNPCKLNNQ